MGQAHGNEVPKDYIAWLQNTSDAYKASKPMPEAVKWHLSNDNASANQSCPQLEQENISPDSNAPDGTIVVPYVLPFGKDASKRVEDVPAEYIAWLKTGDRFGTDAQLRAAIAEWEKVPRV